jgi:hypothetical protein
LRLRDDRSEEVCEPARRGTTTDSRLKENAVVVAVASLIVLLAGAVVVAAFVGRRAVAGNHFADDLRRYDEPVRLRPRSMEEVSRAA